MKKTMLILALAALATAPGWAQGPGFPPPPAQGGPAGMRPMGPPMMRMAGPHILMRQDVQRELKLTQTQIEKVRELLQTVGAPMRRGPGGFGPGRGQGGPGGGFGPGPGGPGGPGGGFGPGPGGPPPGGQGGNRRQGIPGGPGGPMNLQQREEMESKIRNILSQAQFARYQELSLQFEGPRVIGRPDIAKKLGLSDAQLEELRSVMIPPRPPMPMGDGSGQPPAPPTFETMEKIRQEHAAKILAVLTDAQRQKWNGMLGKTFKFDQPAQGFRPGRGR